MKKKNMVLAVVSILCVSMAPFSFAAEASEPAPAAASSAPLVSPDFAQNPLNALIFDAISTDTLSAITSDIIVKVCSPCDEEWRAKYSSWMFEANTAIENADELMLTRFGIDLRSVAQQYWDSMDTSPNQGLSLLDEAWNEWGLRNGAQIMIAFSGQMHGSACFAYNNGRQCIIFDQGRNANSCTTRFSVGILYGCPSHYYNPNTNCVMNDCYNMYNSLCASCNSTWYNNRNSK